MQKTGGLIADQLVRTLDYVLWYGKDRDRVKWRALFEPRTAGETTLDRYDQVQLPDDTIRYLDVEEDFINGALKPGLRRLQLTSLESANPKLEFEFGGRVFSQGWKTNIAGMHRLVAAKRVFSAATRLRYIRFVDDFPVVPITDRWESMQIGTGLIYVVQTANSVVAHCLLMTTDPGNLVLDPTCGSGTTAYVAEQWGRRWITIDTSRVALALARTRLMSAKYPYYYLLDSDEGLRKEAELTGKLPPPHKTEGDIRKGFVYKRVPHVTLKSIANNPDIKEGMTREEIDAAIARHAESETLYDQPYEDNKRVRVSGPFTVESLSPHRVLSTADENLDGTVTEQEARKHQDFGTTILDNLKKAGVQNTKKNERLTFDTLEPYAGRWIHAAGTYQAPSPQPSPTRGEGESTGAPVLRRVAISIGPVHGTVSADHVKEAGKEAIAARPPFDIAVVCGFAFDPSVGEEAKAWGKGKLTILLARMNPDLAMGDELLKKTGAGNLFMVFGEPDVEIKKKDGQIVVEIKGVDVYDPTTGQIRSSSTDDIACWFIDTDYNSESFFVRHAYFTGAQEPYDKLKRALRAEIDETAWSTLYSTVSAPLEPPMTGKIAVKVINHYGDEVFKVFGV